MKPKIHFFLCLLMFILAIPAIASLGRSKQSNTKPILEVVFFRVGKEARVSLAEIQDVARRALREKYSDFPKDIGLGSLHIECRRSRQTFYFYYASGDIGGKFWDVKLSADLKVQHIGTGKVVER